MTLPSPGPDRTCVVTGASSGIGTEFARILAGRGYGVTLVARREERLHELAAGLSSAHGVRTEVISADLTDGASRSAIADRLTELGLTVDVLVNNAGFSTSGPIHQADRDREVALVRTDVEAVVDLCTRFVAGMVERRRGAILNVSSTAAFQPLPGQAAYAAAKAFVLSYTHALRAEVARAGVSVTALCPGPVDTGFFEATGMSREQAARTLPRPMWLPAAEVARAAIDGLQRGRAVVIPGTVNRMAAVAADLAPRGLIAGIVARGHPAMR